MIVFDLIITDYYYYYFFWDAILCLLKTYMYRVVSK